MKPFDILFILSRKSNILNHLFSHLYHCDIPKNLKLGTGVKFIHKRLGVVITEGATIGNNVCIQHHVLIGEKNGTDYPIIEDDVVINPYCIILGNIRIGSGSVIGAGSIVTKNIPQNCLYYNKVTPVYKILTEEEKIELLNE